MNDPRIREILKKTELLNFINDKNSKVVEELKLPVAGARIDIAVINGHLHGYEIKSAQDTLQRLPSQIIAYTKVFDYLTVVTEVKYYEKILNLLPEWVGVAVCKDYNGYDELEIINPPTLNENIEGFHICKLLWHAELTELLESQQIAFNKKSRIWILCEILERNVEINILSKLVREKLKKRKDWKVKELYQLM